MITGSMSTRYTHGSRRAKSGGALQPPDLAGKGSLFNFKQFANPRRILGDDRLDEGSLSHFNRSSVNPQKPANTTTPQTRKGGIRDAFKALVIPLNTRKVGLEQQTPLSPIKSPVYELPEAESSAGLEDKTALDEQLSMAHSYYNVPPEDYAVYRQLFKLLQPNDAKLTEPWAPSFGQGSSGHAQSNTSGTIFDMAGDTMFPVEMDSWREGPETTNDVALTTNVSGTHFDSSLNNPGFF